MFYRTGRTSSNTLQLAIILLAATSAGATGIIDRVQEITEHLRSQEFTAEGFDVVEVFRAETTEDLEAAVLEGYPMPWLEEILSDETIPEEDRYWLDYRMRAIIAQDLHLFFDRDGNPVTVEADFIGPGEDYWREHMMVNPPGRTDIADEYRPTMAFGDSGYILNLYGERVGELAEVRRSVSLSRDASIAAVVSGGTTMEFRRDPYACFMYPDGSFMEIPFDTKGSFDALVSNDGEVVAFQCVRPSGMRDPHTYERNEVVGDFYVFDPSGNLIQRISPPVIFSPGERGKISSTGRFICDNLCTGEVFLIDCEDNYSTRMIRESEGGIDRHSFNFSPDGNYLCAGGHSSGLVIDLDSFETAWESNARTGMYDYVRLHSSNGAECIASTTMHGDYPDYYYELEVYLDNDLMYSDTAEGRYNEETIVSPNGHFLLTRKDHMMMSNTSLPTAIRHISREGSE